MEFPIYAWLGFFVFLIIALGIDLGIAYKKPRVMTFKEASIMVSIWVLLSSMFCTMLLFLASRQKALEFITGYVVELSLSMDNVFVFIMLFTYFKIPKNLQHKVLFWGIIGAIVMRLIMITGGILLFQKFNWIFYIFGAFLIYTGIKIALVSESANDVKNSGESIMNFLRQYINISKKLHGNKFFAKEGSKRVVTPLFIVLLMVEKTDLIFALDSIPAIIAITQDPFIIFTSNIFAILGLRSLYFMLANLMERFALLKYGISIILVFVGIKMIISMLGFHIQTVYSLLFIVTVLALSMLISFVYTRIPKRK